MSSLSRRTFLQNLSMGISGSALAATVPSFMNIPVTNSLKDDGKKINIALCGLGRYAKFLATGLESTQYCRLAGIITGTPAKVEEWKKRYNIPQKNIYNIMWQFEFPGGVTCNSTSSYNCIVDRFFASADEGFFELSPGLGYGPYRGKTSKGELNFPTINQQAVQCDEIAKTLLSGQQLPDHITAVEGIKDMKILHSIYEAAETGKKVSINLI